MAIQLKDRIYTNCPTIGKADIEIGVTKEGYQGWESITDGNTVYYCITDDTEWEVGYGVKTGTEIVRNLLSSSTGSLLSLNGNASVFCTYPAEKAVLLNLDGNIEIPSSNVNAKKFSGDGGGITNIDAETNNLAPEAPTDGETYARNNKTWVSISDTAGIPDAPVDGLMYGRKDGEWGNVADATNIYTKTETNILLDAKADKSNTYTKTETYSNVEVDTKLFEKADKATTYTKSEVDSSQSAQNSNIATNTANISTNTGNIATNTSNIATNTGNITSNTTAIGTLSGQVAQNSEDIGELQNSIFFTSAYSADYPSSPNRDPENGNMYLQNFAMFTYSYAEATQIFCSKTDESGNVRQFTAVQPGDSIVLNEVNSPNFGRYELVTIEDVSDSYVVMNVIPELGQGTVITGANIAFQAFPKPGSDSIWTETAEVAEYDGKGMVVRVDGDLAMEVTNSKKSKFYGEVQIPTLPTNGNPSNVYVNDSGVLYKSTATPSSGGIPEAPVDGKQYGRQDAEWTEVTGGDETSPVTFRSGSINEGQTPPVGADFKIAFGTPATSEGGTFDGTYFTPQTEGWYQTSGSVFINAPTSSRVGCLIQKNGTSQLGSFNQGITAVGGGSASASGLVYCNGTTDKLSLAIVCNEPVGALGGTPNTIWFSAILSTGGSSSGGGSGGGTTDILPVLLSGNINADGSVMSGTGFTASSTATGVYVIDFDKSIPIEDVNFYGTANDKLCILTNKSPSQVNVRICSTVAEGTNSAQPFNFQIVGSTPIAVGGGSGGSYTPEPMIWEDVTAERSTAGLYTNSNDVPLDVIVGLQHPSQESQSVIKIDGVIFGYIGMQTGASGTIFPTTTSFTVPSGSTYAVNDVAGVNSTIQTWFEAKMPVAVGTGGGGTPSSFARIVDKKAATVAGGSSIAGTQSRALNTIQYDDDNIATLDGNDVSFTLQAGTYVIDYSAPGNRVGAHNVLLYDLTEGQFVNTGTTNYSLDNASNTSFGNYSVTLTEPHSYKVSHYTEEARASSGLGNLNPVNDGIFATVDIQKVGTGGASSGGGSGWEETVLFENATGATNFALSESYDSFDYLRFDTVRTDPAGALNHSDMIPVDLCNLISLDSYSSLHMYYSCADKINFTNTSTSSVLMTKVVGINTGSSSSVKVKALEARLDALEKKLK